MLCPLSGSFALSSLEGRTRVTENGTDAYGRRAFAAGQVIRYAFLLPRVLAVRGGTLSLCCDRDGSAVSVPIVFSSLEDGLDVFEATLDTAALQMAVGLWFCRLTLDTPSGDLWASGGATLHFTRTETVLFQLSLFRAKHTAPEWIYGGVIYHIFVDRFFRAGNAPLCEGAVRNTDWENGIPEYPPYPGAPLANNTFFGGDLDGVTEKLPYIASLGTRAIYLSPIFRAASNHKYDTGDYTEVDAMFGGERALVRLIEEAKKHGIRILLDGVFNHTGADSRYFNRYGTYETVGAYQSPDSPFFGWYTFTDYPSKYDAWWGIEILPRLNLRDPDCRRYFVGESGVVSRYAAMGIGGMRLDVADELDGDFIAAIKDRLCEHAPDAVLYGEVWEDASNKIAYDRRTRYYDGEELDGVMNYPLRTGILRYLRERDPSALAYYLGEVLPNMPKSAADAAMNLLGTHDTERVLTALGGESAEGKSNDTLARLHMSEEERARAVRMLCAAYLIAATLPGVPSIYYGDEVGLEGYSDPFNRRPFPWHNVNECLLSYYRMMAKVRRDPVYRDGELRLLRLDSDLLAFSREKGAVCAVTVYNNSHRSLCVCLPEGARLLTDGVLSDHRLVLPAGTGAVFTANKGATPSFDFS